MYVHPIKLQLAERALFAIAMTLLQVMLYFFFFIICFQFYSSGVFSSIRCSSYNVNHAMVVTGYGVYGSYTKYWLVKNR